MKLKAVAMTGVMSLAGLGLIGVGAHATFSTSTTSNQTINAGNLSVVLTAPDTACPNVSDGCALLSFPPIGPVGSSFTTGDQEVTMTNNGNISATELVFNLTATASVLANEASMCVTSTGLGTGGSSDYVLYNGPLPGGLNAYWGQNGDTLTVAGTPYSNTSAPTDNYIINIYAGSETTNCGTTFTSTDGGTPANASGGATATPGTSAAPALQEDAEGESVTLTATMTYQG